VAWLGRALDHAVPGGKLNRGVSVIDSYRALVGDRGLSADETHQCHVLGWCVEWLQAFFLVADDMMDHSLTRRGQPCWYRMPGVGGIAINDAFLLEACLYRFLKRTFRSAPCYIDLVELLQETTYQARTPTHRQREGDREQDRHIFIHTHTCARERERGRCASVWKRVGGRV
jgi:farnesyl diphosphate synthase